jgi:hypothetical protein
MTRYGYDLGGSEYRVKGLACVDIQKPNDIELDLSHPLWSEQLPPTHYVNASRILRYVTAPNELQESGSTYPCKNNMQLFAINLDKIVLPFGTVHIFDFEKHAFGLLQNLDAIAGDYGFAYRQLKNELVNIGDFYSEDNDTEYLLVLQKEPADLFIEDENESTEI